MRRSIESQINMLNVSSNLKGFELHFESIRMNNVVRKILRGLESVEDMTPEIAAEMMEAIKGKILWDAFQEKYKYGNIPQKKKTNYVDFGKNIHVAKLAHIKSGKVFGDE